MGTTSTWPCRTRAGTPGGPRTPTTPYPSSRGASVPGWSGWVARSARSSFQVSTSNPSAASLAACRCCRSDSAVAAGDARDGDRSPRGRRPGPARRSASRTSSLDLGSARCGRLGRRSCAERRQRPVLDGISGNLTTTHSLYDVLQPQQLRVLARRARQRVADRGRPGAGLRRAHHRPPPGVPRAAPRGAARRAGPARCAAHAAGRRAGGRRPTRSWHRLDRGRTPGAGPSATSA